MDNDGLMQFYEKARNYCQTNYPDEIKWAQSVNFDSINAVTFFKEFCWAVLCSGMKEKVARGMMERLFNNGFHPETIGHPLKRKALEVGVSKYLEWFKRLKEMPNGMRVDFLDTLPHIGPITKYHLAGNLGLDFAKPDVHLSRIAKRYGYASVQEMCKFIASKTGERIRTVDLVLWRYCESHDGLSRSL